MENENEHDMKTNYHLAMFLFLLISNSMGSESKFESSGKGLAKKSNLHAIKFRV